MRAVVRLWGRGALKRKDDVPFSCPPKRREVRPAVVAGIVSVAAIVIAAVAFLLIGPLAPSASFEVAKGSDAAASSEAAEQEEAREQAEDTTIFVHVGGEVASPGLYEIAESARVNDAIVAAGGFTDEAQRDALNLARTLTDGEQVVVPSQVSGEGAAAASSQSEGSSASASGGKVNINTASADALDSLPGVGKSTAEKIVADRDANGPFKTTEDLKRVAGIGDKKYAQLADLITVG